MGGAPIIRYEYSYVTGSTAQLSDFTTWHSAGNSTVKSLRELTNFVKYHFVVRAVNLKGSSVASNIAAVTPEPRLLPPRKPRRCSCGGGQSADNVVVVGST